MVTDGHGRRGEQVADLIVSCLDKAINCSNQSYPQFVNWEDTDDLHAAFHDIFLSIEMECKRVFGDFDGGATLSVCVDRPGRDFWVAHVGDSDVCLIDLNTHETTLLIEDHSPLNIDEYLRMIALCPTARFEYDRQRKDAPALLIYSATPDEATGWKKNPTPLRNIYYKNRENDIATYVSESGGFSLANTRAIGDFRMKKSVGLSAEPFVTCRPPLARDQRIVLATDGFWDSWPLVELLSFFEARQDFAAIVSDLESTHIEITTKYFGSCSDDTFLYVIQPLS
jgi:serine/threonine protein phosphatase PrpC